MPRVEDVTDDELARTSGPGDYIKRVREAKPATKLTPTLQTTLDTWNRRADKTLPNVSSVLAYGFRYIKPREHINLIRLIKGKRLRLCRINGRPPDGSEAKRQSPYGDWYFLLRESCPSEVDDGTIAGRRRRKR